MRKKLFACIFFLLCLQKTVCSAQNMEEPKKPAQSIEELKQQLEDVLKDMHVPGLSVAIVHQDGPEWIAGLGKADVATGRDATAETLFRVGSISKSFVSLATLKLVNEGKLTLQDPVHKLVPEVWFENRWEESDPVRVVNLLEHTTGWDDFSLRAANISALNMTLLEAFDVDHQSRVCRWPPSTRMSYCNSGPGIAAYIVEKLAGKNFESYIEENFFKPIGMKTATYFQPDAQSTTIVYHVDGKTPYTYWNILYRPTGSVSASAHDMASYLSFYLNRGSVSGAQLLPAEAIERMESPTSTWAAQEGLRPGYGLSNAWTIYDGFVYHGHGGQLNGSFSSMEYMPDIGVGYFYSINSQNQEASNQIGRVIRAYITRALQKPFLPPVTPLPANAADYTGWYEYDSPRNELLHFIDRLTLLSYVRLEDNKFLISLKGRTSTCPHVKDFQFRFIPENEAPQPIATAMLLRPPTKDKFIQIGVGQTTIKRIPTWLAYFEMITTGFVIVSVISIFVYAPFWIFGGISPQRRRPQERAMRLLPLIAALCLVSSTLVISNLFEEVNTPNIGNLTVWSFSLFMVTLVFPAASLGSVIAVWRARKENVRKMVRIYSAVVTTALVITTVYYAYWGIIGLRTWK